MAHLTRRLKRPIVVVVVVLLGGMPFSLPMTSAKVNANTSASSNTSANTSASSNTSAFQTPRRRHLQGISIGSGTSLTTCSANLLVSDTNPRDESLSQSEFVDFVQRTLLESVDDPTCSDGTGGCSLYLDRREDEDEDVLMNGLYQIPISSFHLLPPDLVGVFNRIACGNANYGCLNGIDISGVVREENGEGGLTDQEQAVLFRLCSDVEDAVGELAEAMPTTWATTTASTGTTASALPVCPLEGYVAGTAYAAGDRVVVVVEAEDETSTRSYYSYRCRDFPYTAWCSQEAYAPGTGGNWNMAWVPLGECDGGGDVDVTTATATATATITVMATSSASTTTTTSTDVTWTGSTFGAMERTTTAATTTNVATTSSSSSSSTTTTTTTNPDDPPYTGNVPVRFHYRITNTVGFAAASVPASIEAALLKETTDLVEEVIVDTFGGADDGGGDDGGDGDVFAAMEVDVDVDEYEYDDNGHGGTKRAHLRGIPHDDGGIRRRLRGPSSPPPSPNENNHDRHRHRHRRQLQVVYEPGSVAIVDFEDVDCPVADDTDEEVVLLCQRVHCAVDLILFDEPKHATELQFQKNLSRAIADGAIQLPPEMGVTATSLDSAVVVVPDAVDDSNNNNNNNNNNDNNNNNNNNNNRWQLPVIVTCAVAAVLVALPCVAYFLLPRTTKQTNNSRKRHVATKEASSPHDVFHVDLLPAARDVESQTPKPDPFANVPLNPFLDPIHDDAPAAAGKPNPFIDDDDENENEDDRSSRSDGSSSSSSSGSGTSSSSSSSSSSGSSASCSSSSSSSNDSSTSIESDYTNSSSDSSRESSSTEDIHQNSAVPWTGNSNPNQVAEQTSTKLVNASSAAAAAHDSPRRLPTVEEMPDEDMSKSAMSSYMNLSSSTCDFSMYRAGVEALVKEACPDQIHRIDEMMVEYQGREQLLIGELSTLLAAKQRELDDDDDDEGSSQGLASNSDEWSLTEDDSSPTRENSRSGRNMDSTLSDSDMIDSEGKSLVDSGMTMDDDDNAYKSGGADADANVAKNDVRVTSTAERSDPTVAKGGNTDGVVVGGGATSGEAALLASQASGNGDVEDSHEFDTFFDDDSDGESSGWSSNSDGLSSMNSTSFETSESSVFEITRASSLAAIAKATKLTDGLATRLSDSTDPKVTARAGSNSPNGASADGSDHSSKHSDPKVSRKDLDAAIEAGDWQAVGATAALLAHADVEDTDSVVSHRSYSSKESDLSSMEIHRASEIEKLVQEGDWEGIIKAATKYDGTSDTGERVSNVSTISSDFRGSDLSRDISDIRTEVEELVCRVVPDEIDNVDEMMLQFQGREDELVETLKTMEERMATAKSDTNMTSRPHREKESSPKSGSEGGNSIGASIEDFVSSPCEIFERESAVGSIETPQGSVGSNHVKRSSETSTSTGSGIGDIVLDSGSEEGNGAKH